MSYPHPKLRPYKAYVPNSNYLTTEASFRKLEPFIERFMRGLPDAVTYQITNIKHSTWINYMRRTLGALLHPSCNWKTSFDLPKLRLLLIDEGIALSAHDGKKIATMSLRGDEIIEPTSPRLVNDVTINASDYTTLRALLHLKNLDLIPNPLTLSGVSHSDYPTLQNEFPNISLGSDGDLTVVF